MWAKGIVISFVLFATFMIVLVGICLNQDIALESKDYYKNELKYQNTIDKMNNTTKFQMKPRISYDSRSQLLKVDFVDLGQLKGKVQFYKPDLSRQDFNLGFTQNLQIDMKARHKGLWKIKLDWEQDGKAFFYEEPIFVD